jgi:hypothetical protein
MAENGKTSGLGEDFASELSGYGQLVDQVGDTVVRSLLYLEPFGAFMQSFGLFILPFGILTMLGISGIRSAADRGESVGQLILSSTLAFILLTSVNSVTFNYTNPKDPNSTFGSEPIVMSNQAAGTVYPLKGGLTLIALFQSGFDNFKELVNYGVSTEQVYRFINKRHLNGIDEDSAASKGLKDVVSKYYELCTPIATKSVLDIDGSLKSIGVTVENRDFQLLGLLGGAGLGDGFYVEKPIGDVDPTTINKSYEGSPASASIPPSKIILEYTLGVGDKGATTLGNTFAYKKKSDAIHALYTLGRDSSQEVAEFPIYSYDYWLKLKSNGETEYSNSNEVNPDVVSPLSSPFYKYVSRKEINISDASDEYGNMIKAKSTSTSKFLVKDCWSSYVAAETAMTHFLDATGDAASNTPDFLAVSRKTQRKENSIKNSVLGPGASRAVAMSSFSVQDAQRAMQKIAGSNGAVSAVKSAGFAVTSYFKESLKVFTVMGLLSVLIVGLMAVYVSGPLLFGLSPFFGIDIITVWFKLLAVFIVSIIISILIINLGALMMFQVLSNHFVNGSLHMGSPDINDNMLLNGIYMGTLSAVGIVEIAVAYIIVFKEGGALRSLNGDGTGLGSAVGKLGLAAGLAGLRFAGMVSGGGASPGFTGGSGGSTPGTSSGTKPTPEAFAQATRPSAQLSHQPNVNISPLKGTFLPGPKSTPRLPKPPSK